MTTRGVNILVTVILLGGIATTVYLFTQSKADKKEVNNPKLPIKNSAKKITSILFVGDSNTFANFSYADQLKKMYPNLKIKKIAMNGANTSWMRTQLQNELQNNTYDVISILGGSNDIYGGKTIAETKSNLNAMYNLTHSAGAKVLAISPPNKDFYLEKTDAKQKMLNDLVDWMKENKNIDDFIDFKSMTNDKAFFTSADEFLHPQANAHKLLAQKTKQELNIA